MNQGVVAQFEAPLATKLGVAHPKTVALPNKDYVLGIHHQESLRNLIFPLDWDAFLADVGLPCVLKDAHGGGWRNVAVCRSLEEIWSHYNQSGMLTMVLQKFIDFDSYFRCLAIGQKDLLKAYLRAGKSPEATALVTEAVRAARQWSPADSPELAAELADVGQTLLEANAYAAAEPLLRESLSLGEQKVPDAWRTHHARSLLGGALLGQKRYGDAEPLLSRGYAGLKACAVKIPPESGSWEQGSLTTAVKRLAQLYDAWDKPDEAAKWRKELEAHRQGVEKTVKPKDK